MCGLLGGVGPGIGRLDENTIRGALALIQHRGPDAEGLWQTPTVMLGHRRLSIIDLDPRAHQPMRRGSLTIVFNGEIYNYRALRHQLEARGHAFVTSSDTEVLLAGWQQYGPAFLEQVEGMFAFGIWDERDCSLTLARDRYGEKPLFVLTQQDRILFSSELGALESLAQSALDEDPRAIGLYFRFSYVPAPLGPLKGTSQLEPGTWMRIAVDLTSRTTRYYEIPRHHLLTIPYSEAVTALRDQLTKVVQERLAAADVPVATLLSGGLDSSIITVLADRTYGRPIRAYSLSFPDDPDFDEGRFARAVADHLPSVEHRFVPARVDDLLAFTEVALDKLSEPLADSSLVPTAYLLSKVEEKVVLGGDGADEVFAGYAVYPSMTMSAHLPRLVKRALRALPRSANPTAIARPPIRAAALFLANLDLDPVAEYLNWRTYAAPAELAPLGITSDVDSQVTQHLAPAGSGRLRDIQAVDIAFNLPNDMLRKVDIASMMFGIEGRLPYLDSGLVKFSLSLPDNFRVMGSVRKRILRDAFAADLPAEILTRRKMGFLMPIRAWFRRGPLRNHIEQLIANQTRFDPAPVRAAIASHAAGERDHSVLLWSLYVYLRWRAGRGARLSPAV